MLVSAANWNTVRAKVVACFPHLFRLDDKNLACNACRLCVPGLNGLDLWTLAKVAEGATIEVGGEGSPAKKKLRNLYFIH